MARTAVITGASGRIGGAVATRLEAEGWAVVRVGHAPPVAPRPERWLYAELTDPAQARGLAAQLAAPSSEIDALVHCASRLRSAPVLEDDAALWRHDLALEAEALHTLSAAWIPGMRARGFGRVVAFGLAGLERWPGYQSITGHAVAKGAALLVARALARATVGQGITVNVVAPGVVGDAPGAALLGPHPPEDPSAIAAIVAYLLSDQARAVTGAIVPAGGPVGLGP